MSQPKRKNRRVGVMLYFATGAQAQAFLDMVERFMFTGYIPTPRQFIQATLGLYLAAFCGPFQDPIYDEPEDQMFLEDDPDLQVFTDFLNKLEKSGSDGGD